MQTDILLGGGKKFGKLVLIHPHRAIFAVKQNRCLAVLRVIDDNVAILMHHLIIYNKHYEKTNPNSFK